MLQPQKQMTDNRVVQAITSISCRSIPVRVTFVQAHAELQQFFARFEETPTKDEKKAQVQFTKPLNRRQTAIAKFEDCLKERNQITSDHEGSDSDGLKQNGLYDLKKCGSPESFRWAKTRPKHQCAREGQKNPHY